MKKEVVIILAEDDEGHAALIKKNLKRTGISNPIIHFKNGQETLHFLLMKGEKPHIEPGKAYLLILDIRMPKVNGYDVLREIKQDNELRKMPVIILTTTDDAREVENCYKSGCSNYITKPVDYDKFVKAIKQLGLFLLVVEIPVINGRHKN